MKYFICENYYPIIIILVIIAFFASREIGFNEGYKKGCQKGYENAVEDFYNGKLKCERIEETKTNIKYIWKEK